MWHRGPDGFRTCSSCGSLHFDDFMEIARRSLTDARYAVEPSTKSYKVYVKQPNVVNASQGAIKFYTDHLPGGRKLTDDEQGIYKQAVKISHDRFQEQIKKHRRELEEKYG